MEKTTKSFRSFSESWKALIGQKEKKCNKCGFVTFSLHVLHKHKYKCQGQLLGYSITCFYCRRKFNFLSLYRTHRVLCLKKIKKLKYLKMKLRENFFGTAAPKTVASEKKFSCPICQTSFSTKEKFLVHLKQPSCDSNLEVKKPHSARKSFSAKKNIPALDRNNTPKSEPKSSENTFTNNSWFEHSSLSGDELFFCKWCKSYYPTKNLLHKHLEANYKCARVYYKAKNSNFNKHSSLTARKSIGSQQRTFNPIKKYGNVAKKTFPSKKYQAHEYNKKARKSFPSSQNMQQKHNNSVNCSTSPKSILFNCPVCHIDFADMYVFFQHQKKYNHWGKATKSLPSSSASGHNHTDVSKEKIKEFLKSHTCSFCTQTFATELEKQQHIRIHHPSLASAIDVVQVPVAVPKPKSLGFMFKDESSDSDYDPCKEKEVFSVSKTVRKKLRQQPNICPYCSKTFPNINQRNQHFNEIHLKIYECPQCKYKCKSASILNKHINGFHRKQLTAKKYECQDCKLVYPNEVILLQHVLKSHSEKHTKSCLPTHMTESSRKETTTITKDNIETVRNNKIVQQDDSLSNSTCDYYCDVCGLRYQKLCGLASHRKSKLHKDMVEKSFDAAHKAFSNLPPPQPLNVQAVRKIDSLVCSECSENFTDVKHFVPHRLSHFSVQSKYLKITQLNPYMCEICSEVLDTHSKVQLHLFWHLQVESTANNKTSDQKKSTTAPDRMSGKPIAKKSFSKQGKESLQEITIRGVPKTLFTCEACNVGFTTKEHYAIHVRKLCKKLKQPDSSSKNIRETVVNKGPSFEGVKFSHCLTCNFLFTSSEKFEQHKPQCCKTSYDCKSQEYIDNLYAVKSSLNRDLAEVGCISCGAIFDKDPVFATHIATHKDRSGDDEEIGDILHCAFCNCLFPLHTFKQHKEFCNISYDLGDNKNKSKYMDILKSALELNCAAAGCLTCGEPIDDLDQLVKHLKRHQEKKNLQQSKETNICNGEKSQTDEMDTSDSPAAGSAINIKSAKSSSNGNVQKDLLSKKRVESTADSAIKAKKMCSNDNDHQKLREDFSRLLCLLISDSELMDTLGYGTLPVDKVLVNVLEQMGQEICTTNKLCQIEKFRINIRTLLELCLKDQIMEAIGSNKTIDEIVVEALKILDSEENMEESDPVTA